MPDTTPPAQPGSDGSIAELQRDIDSIKVRRDSWNVVTFVVAALALLGSVIGVGFAAGADSSDSSDGGAAASGGPQTVEIELGDLYVKPSSIEVPAGTELTVVVTNAGAMAHDLKLDGETGTGMIDPGGSENVTLGVISEDSQAKIGRANV